ncbi:MAG: PilZ domain-containing protein [Thermoanaerobaculia bacterium]
MSDRRGETRHEIILPISVDGWAAMTRDVSTTGVYFLTQQRFSAGTKIDFDLPLPRLATANLAFICHATILRVDARDHQCGVAARIDRFTIVPSHRPAQSH